MTATIRPGSVPTARLSDAPLPPVDPSIPPWPGRTVRVNGTDLYVATTPDRAPGGGEPALYVHGLGGATTNFTDFAGLLSGRLAGEAIDLPGFGRSGPVPRGGYSLDGHARTVIAYLEHRGAGPSHLVGNSLGGVVTILVAATRPDLVRTLTLVSPAMPTLRRGGQAAAMPLLLLPYIGGVAQRRLDAMPAERRARGVVNLCFADPSIVPEHRLQEAIDDIARRKDLPFRGEAFRSSLRGLATAYATPGPRSLWRRAGAVRAPSLVVWGEKDKLVPVGLAPRTAAAIPGARLLVLPNVGHAAQMEAPDVTARAVLGLLEDANS